MINSQVATAVVLRDLNCFSLETINDRILLQKKVYLAQDIGMPLGYGYSWYIHGPYSTDLTAVAYQVIPEGIDSIEGKTLKAPYDAMISKVNDLEKEMDGLKIGVVQWYELIASIAYWYKRGYTEETRAIEKIKETKPQFSEKQAQTGPGVKFCVSDFRQKSRMALESRADSGLNPLITESHGGQNGMRAGTA